jgi:putative nucleotidyltransferase with HDIG domain
MNTLGIRVTAVRQSVPPSGLDLPEAAVSAFHASRHPTSDSDFQVMLPSRSDAHALMCEFTQSESLRKHMYAVEAAMRAYAARFGEDVDRWGLAGLMHDFDYERWPNHDHHPETGHPAEGVRHLRGLGYPEDVLEAILGHASYSGVPRSSLMARTLFAVDELTGLITATALVRPSRSVHEVDARSVQKKMKDKAFARGVSREDVINGAEDLGVELEAHIRFVIEAMQGEADALGLAGTSTVA